MFRFLGCSNLFHFNNIKAAAAAPTIQSLQYPILFQQSYSSQSTQQQPSSLIQYLQASLGFSSEGAQKISKRLRQNVKKPDIIPIFLKSHGFSQIDIKSMIERHPILLYYAFPESKLAPKIQFFKEKGFSHSDVMRLMVTNPRLLTRSLGRSIKPFYDLIHSILGRPEFVVELLNRRWIFNPDTWATNIAILRNCGVEDHRISKIIRRQPGIFNAKPDRLIEVVEMVKQIGFRPLLGPFMEAVYSVLALTDQSWDMKFKVYRSVGWSDEEMLSAFRKNPVCMRLSEKNIRKSMDYFTKEIGWDASYISMRSILLGFSLEKRIMPRHKFLQFLVSKGYVKIDAISYRAFCIREQQFLNEYVMRYESEAPGLLKIYEDLVGSRELNTRDGKICNL